MGNMNEIPSANWNTKMEIPLCQLFIETLNEMGWNNGSNGKNLEISDGWDWSLDEVTHWSDSFQLVNHPQPKLGPVRLLYFYRGHECGIAWHHNILNHPQPLIFKININHSWYYSSNVNHPQYLQCWHPNPWWITHSCRSHAIQWFVHGQPYPTNQKAAPQLPHNAPWRNRAWNSSYGNKKIGPRQVPKLQCFGSLQIISDTAWIWTWQMMALWEYDQESIHLKNIKYCPVLIDESIKMITIPIIPIIPVVSLQNSTFVKLKW